MSLWEQVLTQVKKQISVPAYEQWFTNTRGELIENRLVVYCGNDFASEWLESRYHHLLLNILTDLPDSINTIKYVDESKAPIVEMSDKGKKMIHESLRDLSEGNYKEYRTVDDFIKTLDIDIDSRHKETKDHQSRKFIIMGEIEAGQMRTVKEVKELLLEIEKKYGFRFAGEIRVKT